MIEAPVTPTAEDFERLLATRHSCRAFRPDPVPRATIESLLAAAQWAPSWCNTQPWSVYLTEGDATERFRVGLAHAVRSEPQDPDYPFPEEYNGVYRYRRKECAEQLYTSVGIPLGDRQASARQTMKNFDLFGAPHVAVLTCEESLGVYGAVDCGLYLGTLLLAAHSHGIAAVPQAAVAGCAPFVRQFFDIPPQRKVLCAVSFGFEDHTRPENRFRTTRADLDAVVTWCD